MAKEDLQEAVINSIVDVAKDANFMDVVNSVGTKMTELVNEHGEAAVDVVLALLQLNV